MKSYILSFHWSAPLVCFSDWSNRPTESELGSKPWDKTIRWKDTQFHWSVPLVSRSNGSGRRTESENISGPSDIRCFDLSQPVSRSLSPRDFLFLFLLLFLLLIISVNDDFLGVKENEKHWLGQTAVSGWSRQNCEIPVWVFPSATFSGWKGTMT